MAIYKVRGAGGDNTNIRAKNIEAGPLGLGQPIQIPDAGYPTSATAGDEHKVKLCPDGGVPTHCVTIALDDANAGAVCSLAADRLPLRLGANVTADLPLKVSGGKWVPAMSGDDYFVRAERAGSANDVIPGQACRGKLP